MIKEKFDDNEINPIDFYCGSAYEDEGKARRQN